MFKNKYLRRTKLPEGIRRLESIPSLTDVHAGGDITEELGKVMKNLSENRALVLQHLPGLKNLNLWHDYDGNQRGKEFCKAGWICQARERLKPDGRVEKDKIRHIPTAE
ncbi:unnamed protein product [Dovyalis caffra]|uniref:Uncharacterized protein n=1 Tax=Dovyalis caffra TaxID=77055 RepID=A0AAV1R4U0_9ROSI|nr:unnamed protein product [Dovyalis caffra]